MPTRIETLIAEIAPLLPSQSVGEVFDWFLIHTERVAMPVVFERTVVGILTRVAVMEQAAKLTEPSASKQSIMPLVEEDYASAKVGQPLGEVAHHLAADGAKGFQHGVIVRQAGAYYGYVTATSLTVALSAENTRRAHQMRSASEKLKTMGRQLARERRDGGLSLARLGHEVRTPLTAMLGHTERLLRKDLVPEARQSLDVIARSTESLADLVSRSVEAGRVRSGDIVPKIAPFSTSQLAQDLAALWQPRAEEKGLAFDVSVSSALPTRLEGDAVRIQQILGNLISNAIKYTESGAVHFSLEGLAREEGQVAFSACVADTGRGISETERERLFEPFQRLQSAGGEQGVGLGLSISLGLARAMGGDLTYCDAAEGGSVFRLALPLRRAGPRLATEGVPKTARPTRSAFKLGDILLVEDHAASQALIESTLGNAGWRVDTVATLAQARRRVDHKPYQAILCDYFLRDGQGDVLIKMLRGHPGPNSETLCLAVTADSSEARKRHCLAAGFAGVIAKPIRGPELITTLADFISAAEHSAAEDSAALLA
ncbi:MAG: ATP-binding protein [Pseudomonadota bacterium]